MDIIADMDTRIKTLVFFFILSIVPAGVNLVLLHHYSSKQIIPFAALFLVFMIVIQFPVCGWFSNAMVFRNIKKINDYCQSVKQGAYHASFPLPPEKGEENDFLKTKRNLYWMGRIIAAREEKLVNILGLLRFSQTKVMESIEYASRIQHALLPSSAVFNAVFKDYFVWWEPRDVVGGDTYWVTKTESGCFVAAIDCTGHGVPGAFMTLIVHILLEKTGASEFCNNPGRVLEILNIQLKQVLGCNGTASRIDDGFDAAVCHINAECGELTFAGAGLPLFYEIQGKILEIKGDRMGVGDHRVPVDYHYTNHTLQLTGFETFYLLTDGVTDQVGGRKGLPLGKNGLKQLLARVSGMPFQERQKHLTESWRTYAGQEEKRDDLTLLGFSAVKG